MSLEARKRKLLLTSRYNEDVPKYFLMVRYRIIHSDPNRLKQIYINLIGNALKFTNVGSVTITLKKTESGFLENSIIDTGIGVSEELRKNIFDPFVKGEDKEGQNKNGVGFGLPITKHLCEKLGGRITFSSVLGKGTTFTFWIPINKSIEPNPSSIINSKNSSINSYKNNNGKLISCIKSDENKTIKKILCVDDDPITIFVIKKLLTKLSVTFDLVIYNEIIGN